MIKTGALSKSGRGGVSFCRVEGKNVSWRMREDLMP